MWVATLIRPAIRPTAGCFWKRSHALICDHCGIGFVDRWDMARMNARPRHFCSGRCRALELHPGVLWTTEHRRAASDRAKARNAVRWSDPDERARQAATIVLTHHDPELRARRRQSILSTMATPAYRAKRSIISKMLAPTFMETNRRNGNCIESRPERAFVAWLREVLGAEDVLHHPGHVNGFDMDVFVRSIDTYVQFDGVYYHGLDRPYDRLSPEIRRKYDRDRLADARFVALGQRLVRITDKQWAALDSEEKRAAWLATVLRPERQRSSGD